AGILALGAIYLSQKTAQIFPQGRLGLVLFYWIITASHGVLDAMTDGGLGIAFFAPLDNTRYFLPFRPIPVAPIGLSAFFSIWGLEVLWAEFILFWFFALAMLAWSWKNLPFRKSLAVLLVLVGVMVWAS
ncbi:MAG: metal-dependent hydrolase, partial [Nitrospira sp.]|nr:metal-dependent hydrolase [Nitrospira sp.]